MIPHSTTPSLHPSAAPFEMADRIRAVEQVVAAANEKADEAAAVIESEREQIYSPAHRARLETLQVEMGCLLREMALIEEGYAEQLDEIGERILQARHLVLSAAEEERKSLPLLREALAVALVTVCKDSGLKTIEGETFDLQLACKPKITVADTSRAFDSLKEHVRAEKLSGYIEINKAGIDLVSAMVKAKDAADFEHEEAVNKEIAESFPGFTLEVQRIPKILEKKCSEGGSPSISGIAATPTPNTQHPTPEVAA